MWGWKLSRCSAHQASTAGTSGQGQLEIWPEPDQDYRGLYEYWADEAPFTEDTHRCSIPDRMVFMLSLANAKAHYRQEDAQSVAQQVDNMLATIRSRQFGNKRYRKQGFGVLANTPFDGRDVAPPTTWGGEVVTRGAYPAAYYEPGTYYRPTD